MVPRAKALIRSLHFDVIAGLTVAIVALPLALGFGVTSGAGAAAGLITAIVAGVVAGVFGGSRFQVSGPTGAMVVVLSPILATLGISSLLPLGIIAGVFLLAFAALRVGRYIEKVPWPVMEGFTLGIAVVIALQQIPLIFNVEKAEGSEVLLVAVRTTVQAFSQPLEWWSLAVVTATLTIKILWSGVRTRWRFARSLPASAMATIVVSVGVALAHLPVATIGELPLASALSFNLEWAGLTWAPLIWAGLIVAVLAAVESLLSARVGDAMVHRRDGDIVSAYSPNRELFGQGMATLASAIAGGMPATGAIARTGVNVNAGARTRMAAVMHSVALLLFVTLLPTVIGHIPLAVLAGVLLGTSWRIANPGSIRESLHTVWPDRLSFVVTALGVVALDLIWGIVLGLIVHALATYAESRRTARH
jgi:SulP family sulfate permease